MTTSFNPQRQSYMKYDNTHYLLFLQEQEAEQTNELGEKMQGYTYTGPRQDGSTLIEATGVTSENIRGKFIAGLLGLEYSLVLTQFVHYLRILNCIVVLDVPLKDIVRKVGHALFCI